MMMITITGIDSASFFVDDTLLTDLLSIALWDRYYYPCFADQETEAEGLNDLPHVT